MATGNDQGEPTVHVTARVPAALAQAFEELAAVEDRSVSAELRRAMRARLDQLGAPTSGGPEARFAGGVDSPRSPPKAVFGFFDETGTVHAPQDQIFAVGLLRCHEPSELLRPIKRLRATQQFHDEVKWAATSAASLPLLQSLVDVFFASGDAAFWALVVNKRQHHLVARFGGAFEAYEAVASDLVRSSIRPGETMWMVADEYPSPPTVTFEETVRDRVNLDLRPGAVAGVCRMRSSGVDLLQLADLMLGSIAYEHKLAHGQRRQAAKAQLLDHLKQKAGVQTFVGGCATRKLHVADYQ